MKLRLRTDTALAGALALVAFASVPTVWIYLVLAGQTWDQIESHPIGPWTNGEWSWAYSVAAQCAVFSAISGKPVIAVWKPVVALHLIVVPATLLLFPLLFFAGVYKDAQIYFFAAFMLAVWGTYRLPRWIIDRWYAERLRWRDAASTRALLAAVTLLPALMALAGNVVHGDFLYFSVYGV